MTHILLLIGVLLMLSCSSIDSYNQFSVVTDNDLSNLDSLNQIIFRNKDKINSDFESSLKGHDSLQYQKSFSDFGVSGGDTANRRFELFTSDLNTSDSIVVYQIKMESYNGIDIYHSLVYQADPSRHSKDVDNRIVKTKQLTPNWTYNIINDKPIN